jgi:adenylate cyclase, class 2
VIEAELKARVRDPQALLAALDQRAAAEHATYADTYYDTPDRGLTGTGRELRLRVIDRDGFRTCRLTYKEAAVLGTGSKPEHETSVADREMFATLFAGLGLTVLVELTKNCTNYRFDRAGRPVLATVVTVPELRGTFLEVETLVPTAEEVPAALDTLRDLLAELGVSAADLDSRDYTDLVMRARAGPA